MVAIAYQGWQWQGLVSRASEVTKVDEVSDVEPWKRVHARLRRIAKKRAALDHEELQLIRKAIVYAIWRHFGMTSVREYLEHVMGYGPTVASERVRVAEALDAMPVLEDALRTNALSYSAVREITRIATAKTEAAWVAACCGKNLRQIEDLLAEREPGDRPESPRKPDLRAKDKTFRGLKPATLAALAVARKQLETERGERLDDDELLAALANRVTGGEAPSKRAATQVAVTMCPACQTARQTAGNQTIALRPEELSRALCDAQWIDVTGQHRSVQDITPALRQKILARDHYRCRVPGCRATRCIEIHHIVPRWLGGPHVPENLITLCDGHHAAHHRGEIEIEGPASTAIITMVAALEADRMARDEALGDEAGADQALTDEALADARTGEQPRDSHVEKEALDFHVGDWSGQQAHESSIEARPAEQRSDSHVEDRSNQQLNDFHVEDRSDHIDERDAVLALTTLGFKKPVAVAAVAKARDQLAPKPSLEALIRAALRGCPR